MLRLKNNEHSYGLVAILLHWLIAACLIALFASGLWMTTLDYYHPWYHKAPVLHISVGVVVTLLVLLRIFWSLFSHSPQQLADRLFTLLAQAMHVLLHLLPLLIAVSGYLMVTAEGQGVAVFTLFELPPLLEAAGERADSAGKFHLWLAWSLMILSLAHALAAVYHHFVLHDAVLVRMFALEHTLRGE
jgi:cytochrome b561